jgi:UDP-N-acetylmuramoyl-tripeptide--D-alanyl-D-alanine ligase
VRWSINEVAAATGGTVWGPSGPDLPGAGVWSERTLHGVSIDSRTLPARALFVAIRADRDGHAWIGAALQAGAAGLLVDEAWARAGRHPQLAVPVVAVPDTSRALLALGRAARDRMTGTVIGITGSVGKTSTKDLAAAALAAGLQTAAAEKSFNNELGVPLTLANARADSDAAVIEMGARGRGHIARLCTIARPDVGVVTTVVAAHTAAFGDLDAVAAAKAELVEALPPAGTAVLNADNPRVLGMADRTAARTLRYSVGPPVAAGADLTAEGVMLDDRLRPRFDVRSPWGAATVRLEARGVHQVGNALAALAVALSCGVPLPAAVSALECARLSPWRMELGRAPNGAVILNDAYNANPTSVAAALDALAALPARRRVAVLGEMAELGARSDEEHRAIAALADRMGLELLAVGTDAYGVPSVLGIDEAVAALGCLDADDAVLVKASRVAGLERLASRLLGDAAADERGT